MFSVRYPNCCHCVKFQSSPASQRHSAFLYFVLVITCITHVYVYNPEINRETHCFCKESLWISTESHSWMWGPQGILTWGQSVFSAYTLPWETRAPRGQVWQLKVADFFPAVAALPTQVEWTIFFSSCAQKAWIYTSLNQIPQSVLTSLSQIWDVWWSWLQRKQSWKERGLASVPAEWTKVRANQARVLVSDLALLFLWNGIKIWNLKTTPIQTFLLQKIMFF